MFNFMNVGFILFVLANNVPSLNSSTPNALPSRTRMLANNNNNSSSINNSNTSTNSSLDACKVPNVNSSPLAPLTVNSLASTVGSASANLAIVPNSSTSTPHDNSSINNLNNTSIFKLSLK